MIMEPKHNSDYLPPMELPTLHDAEDSGATHESPAAAPENRGLQQPASLGASTSATSMPGPLPAASALPADDGSGGTPPAGSSASTNGLIADDADLIEKEWVMKAKAIVMQTKNDPHLQNIKINDMKADYLKKRYNKDIKVSGT